MDEIGRGPIQRHGLDLLAGQSLDGGLHVSNDAAQRGLERCREEQTQIDVALVGACAPPVAAVQLHGDHARRRLSNRRADPIDDLHDDLFIFRV